ncbi:MAG: Tyrosine--tRNA ligase 1 [Firmicutes bacterium ADurb.Bin300]|nr:MAG: Tyrosine--tRNA ligase 1 [Firmicutes bacterium ADurb.Bin300]
MNIFDELKARGLVAQMTDEEKTKDMLTNKKVRFYIGFDPTADSLHIGHFIQIIIMSHMQKAGHIPIVLFGGGTAMVGDPSGKTDMRKMLDRKTIAHNIECFKTQMSRLIDFDDGKAIMVNNASWLEDLNYIDFLRDIGVHFSVNRMLAAECYKQRLETGLSFFEMNYMIMQSYDFLYLRRNYDCVMQLGGDDQWSNIIGGVELNRRADAKEVYGMTFNLLLTSDGKKMGKTEKGAVWLDREKTSPYEFYQYWRNINDADVIKCLKMLTFIPIDEIAKYEAYTGSELNSVKELLAFEVTKLIHGETDALEARNTAKALFSGAYDIDTMPTSFIKPDDFKNDSIAVIDLLTISGLCPSKGDARRVIEQGGVSVDDEKVSDFLYSLPLSRFDKGFVVLKKGKKQFIKISLKLI